MEQLSASVRRAVDLAAEFAGEHEGGHSNGDPSEHEQQNTVKHGASVPCNGCTACCWNDLVPLTKAERDSGRYRWHLDWVVPGQRAVAVLDSREDGACVYVTDDGCSIHGQAPGICARMDCRTLYRETSTERREQRMKENPQMIRIYEAAKMRMSA